MSGRRGPNDLQWKEARESVRKRDKICQCCKLLTPGEFVLKKRCGLTSQSKILDAAHIKPVSLYPQLTYDINNIRLLCRDCHRCIDNFLSPVDGKPLSTEEHEAWWERIIKG